jgi:hypothetical protein
VPSRETSAKTAGTFDAGLLRPAGNVIALVNTAAYDAIKLGIEGAT